jgi:hypothetical protein
MPLAPVAIGTYARLGHLKRTVEALQKNTLASASELYIFSDAPQLGDEGKVALVREYIRTIDGFRNVYTVERETNSRADNCRGGMKFLLDRYGKCIFMEEDIVTAPGFLAFMNGALDFYRDDESVFCISGYTVPIKLPKVFEKDVFAAGRMSPWGYGLYPRTFEPLIRNINSLEYHAIQDKSIFTALGHDNIANIERQIEEVTDFGDVKAIYHQAVNKMVAVFPRQSLVRNIGNDGSGENMDNSFRYNIDKLWTKTSDFVFEENIQVDQVIQKRVTAFWNGGLFGLFVRLVTFLGLYKVGKVVISFIRKRILPKNRKYL